MKKIKTVFLFIIICMLFSIAGAFVIHSQIVKRDGRELDQMVMSLSMPDVEKTVKRIRNKAKIQQVVVEKVSSQRQLITMSADLVEDFYWDESITKYEVFKKIQKMTFYGTGKYMIDLNNFNSENISFDEYNNILNVRLKKPEVTVELNPEKTVIYDVDKGLLRFGQIKFTSQELNTVDVIIHNKMIEKLNEEAMLKDAMLKSKQEFTSLVSRLLTAVNIDDVTVLVEFY